MVDIEIIRAKGGTQEELKKIFTKDPAVLAKDHPKVAALIARHSSRLDAGIRQNLVDSRYFWSIDRAFDAPQRQLTYTLVEGVLSGKLGEEEVQSAVKEWGLTSMLTPMADSSGGYNLNQSGKAPKQRLDLPTFFNVFLPLCMSYHKARWAKLHGDLDQWPIYKYAPARETEKTKLFCDMWTSRIQVMSQEMGYAALERDCLHPLLMYGQCLSIPEEDYYFEKQLARDPNDPEKFIEVAVREGIRWVQPHPSRCGWDKSHPLHTLNTNTGCSWFYYWQLKRVGDILEHRQDDVGAERLAEHSQLEALSRAVPERRQLPRLSVSERSR